MNSFAQCARGAHWMMWGGSCAAGDQQAWLQHCEAHPQALLWALDGAYDDLLSWGKAPLVLSGDGDSLYPHSAHLLADSPDEQPQWHPKEGLWVISQQDQNRCDLHKAIRLAQSHQARRIDLWGVWGGDRWDHALWAVSLLQACDHEDSMLEMHGAKQKMRCIRSGRYELTGPVGAHCAIVPTDQISKITSHGLRYECRDLTLRYGQSASICNALAASKVQLEIEGAALLITDRPCQWIPLT